MANEQRQHWSTPDELFQGLHAEFKFTLDVAARASNAKLPNYISAKEGGLSFPWDRETVWCNPPYVDIAPWVLRAVETPWQRAVFLLPARTEQSWFHLAMHKAIEVSFFNRRIQFVPPRGIKPSSNREASVLLVFGVKEETTYFGRRCARTGIRL